MSIGRHNSANSIDSAYQLLVIDQDTVTSSQHHVTSSQHDVTSSQHHVTSSLDTCAVDKLEECSIYNTPPTRDLTGSNLGARDLPEIPHQEEESIYNIPTRNTPPTSLSQTLPPPPSPLTPDSVFPDPPPARSPPKPYLPPRTDRPPVPSRNHHVTSSQHHVTSSQHHVTSSQTLGRPARPLPDDIKPARPQSETMCRPNRPVPLPPSESSHVTAHASSHVTAHARDSHLVEIKPSVQGGVVGGGTLTRAKINQRGEHGIPQLERVSALDNEYQDLSPSSPSHVTASHVTERPVPPPILPRAPIRAAAQSSLPSTPPRIPQRAGTIAGITQQHHNPFLEGWTPPTDTSTLSRSVLPRGVTMYGGIGANRGATLPPPSNRGVTLPPKPTSLLNFSKKAQDEFDAIPDSPTPTEEIQRSSSDPMQNNTPHISGTGKYPTIKSNQIGMVKVKPGYQNVTEVQGALQSRGDAIQGEKHGKLNRRPVPDPGYTPMQTMEERMKRAEKQGYEPMMSHEERMANAQMNQLQSRPLPPRTLNMSGVENSGAAQSPIYVDTSGFAASPIYVDASGTAGPPADISSQPEFRRLGEIDLTVSEFMPMTSGHCTDFNPDEYLTMEGLTYQSRQPQDDYLDMERPAPHDDYLSMTPHLQDDYLAMSSSTENPDQFSKLTFSNG